MEEKGGRGGFRWVMWMQTPDQYRVEYDSRRGNEYSRFHGYTYDGIWAVALAIQHVARRIRHFRRNQTISDFKYRDSLWEMLFLEALRNTSFKGVTTISMYFRISKDRTIGETSQFRHSLTRYFEKLDPGGQEDGGLFKENPRNFPRACSEKGNEVLLLKGKVLSMAKRKMGKNKRSIAQGCFSRIFKKLAHPASPEYFSETTAVPFKAVSSGHKERQDKEKKGGGYGIETRLGFNIIGEACGAEVKVGEYDGVTDTLDLSKGDSLVWRGKSPPKDRTLHIIEHSTVNITIYAVLASAASVGIVMAVVFLAINIRYRNQRYIKMSSPHLNNLIIIGCMFTYSSVIFLGLDSQLSSVTAFPYICTARAWLLMAGFSLAFGSMFSKTWRVHSIFTDVKLNKKVIKDYQLFMVVGVLLVIDLGIMTTWQIADPFYRETKQMEPYPHPSSEDIIIIPENEYCQSNRMTVYMGCIYAYKGLLMIFGAFLAWETRHVSIPALNDSKYVGMSVYNVVIMCVTGAAISFVLADKQDAMFIMLAVFIIFCSTATLCLVFVPKLIELRRNPQGAIDKRMRPTLRPVSKARRDSTVSELEERLKEATTANQKFRKQLLEKDSELQMFLRRLGEDGVADTQEVMDRLTVPRQEGIIKKEETCFATVAAQFFVFYISFMRRTSYVHCLGKVLSFSFSVVFSIRKSSFAQPVQQRLLQTRIDTSVTAIHEFSIC
uniref:G-protein coupled receptors family 3 profile domain-containing protein n=1 Tax=Vespula pensylvanica TaxID=30213 RepID=A0A834P2G9_VESPE|nr:hypothetical protein H0235_007905 [Vespula pensylvanica]